MTNNPVWIWTGCMDSKLREEMRRRFQIEASKVGDGREWDEKDFVDSMKRMNVQVAEPDYMSHIRNMERTAKIFREGGWKVPAEEKRERYIPERILKSGNRTIVFWGDGDKTIVKKAKDEPDNIYAAFTAALAIKVFGSNSKLQRMIKKKLREQSCKIRYENDVAYRLCPFCGSKQSPLQRYCSDCGAKMIAD